jgi:hypothetical protein
LTLPARLTLYYALLAVLMASVISGINLINETQAQFDPHPGARPHVAAPGGGAVDSG